MAWIAVGIGGGMLAGSMMSRGSGGGGSPTYVENDYGQTMKEALTDQVEMAQPIFDAESNEEYGNAYARLNQRLVKEGLLAPDGTVSILAGDQKQTFLDGTTKESRI